MFYNYFVIFLGSYFFRSLANEDSISLDKISSLQTFPSKISDNENVKYETLLRNKVTIRLKLSIFLTDYIVK